MMTQDEILGAIENIIMTNQVCANIDDFELVDSYNEVAIAFNQFLDGDDPTPSFVSQELNALVKKVQGAATWTNWTTEDEAAEQVSQALHEISGSY